MWPFKEKSADHALRELVDSLSRALGHKLVSAMVYGSKASGEYHADRSDVNVFLIVEDASWDTLGLMAPSFRAWRKAGHRIPVFVQKDELSGYAKGLPIEFLDMQDHHRMLMGPDALAGLKVDRVHLRAQCNQELAVKQLRLRQAILLAGGDSKRLRDVLVRSLPSILTLFRAVLRLESDVPKGTKLAAALELARRAGFDGDCLERLGDAHMRRQTDNMDDLARQYLHVVERVLAYVQRQ